MKQAAAKTGLSIKIMTSFVLLLTASILVASLIAGTLLGVICVLCYLFAPVAYALSDGQLIVFSHVGSKQFGPVVRCSQIEGPVPWRLRLGIRLFGNGGLFAGTGIFWNRMYGVHRAYVTSSRYSDLVLVETTTRKILISPENPKAFVNSWGLSGGKLSSFCPRCRRPLPEMPDGSGYCPACGARFDEPAPPLGGTTCPGT
jgi:hypothetical protein